MLGTLCEVNPGQRKALLKQLNREQVHCIAEIALNLLRGNIKISPGTKSKLKRYRKELRSLACPKTNFQKKKKILVQKGGFLGLLLKPALGILGGLLPSILGSDQ